MLCSDRKSLWRTTWGNLRFRRNRKPGRCVGCGTYLARGEGCVDGLCTRPELYC